LTLRLTKFARYEKLSALARESVCRVTYITLPSVTFSSDAVT
jgi:hypothetical protein